MAKTRVQKEAYYEKYVDALQNSTAVFVVDTSNMTSNQVTDIKLKMFDLGASFGVLKNTVFTKAIESTDLKDLGVEGVSGQSGVFFVPKGGDMAAVAKVIKDFQKDFELMEAKFGFLDGDKLTNEQIKAIADLPSREQLLGMTVYIIAAPVRNLMGVMNAATRDLLNVLNAVKEEKGKAA